LLVRSDICASLQGEPIIMRKSSSSFVVVLVVDF
jgi:hypothetical protein